MAAGLSREIPRDITLNPLNPKARTKIAGIVMPRAIFIELEEEKYLPTSSNIEVGVVKPQQYQT